ncbi:hypothetical protein BU26DRAFT_515791 [Trematosphaeria pertusa]|uniref:Uncharacterized protein n=1 Tax=Trematosphaeria pertusa TaxID=390896 RepID=A0A6A6ISF1_9PLEO|nr:uncharacterized protein BU26DRAFT_515791 [Trematosphaeria pertusa]KAF2253434.1 hypothetical protein BU26DRAFT_515791 [Trematosphaeria pertusa]
MRFTISLAVLAAIGAQAAPQVNPITQISDGQIQAPSATSEVPTPTATVVPSVTEVVPTETPVPSVAPSETPVVPVPSAPAANTTIPVVVTTQVPSFANSTVPVTSTPAGTSGAGGSPSASGTAPPAETGAATANMVSLGGLALAVFGFVLA